MNKKTIIYVPKNTCNEVELIVVPQEELGSFDMTGQRYDAVLFDKDSGLTHDEWIKLMSSKSSDIIMMAR